MTWPAALDFAPSFLRHSLRIILMTREDFVVGGAFKSDLTKRITVLGAPIDIGASQRGTLMGPAALRTAGLLTVLDGLGFEVSDHGDLSIADVADLADLPPDNARHYREIQRWTRALSARAYELARSGAIPIFLGGDHTLSMGSVNGIARHWREIGRELFVIWLDAHADYNTPATTISGNMHGMSAAFLCGEPGLDGLLGGEPRAPCHHRWTVRGHPRCSVLRLFRHAGTAEIDAARGVPHEHAGCQGHRLVFEGE